jgi:hypothetical protein
VVLLVAIRVDGLLKVAAAVGQAHRHERQPQVAGALAVVAAQNPQAARVHRQALVHAVLHGEVGDGAALVLRKAVVEPGGALGIEVLAKVAHHLAVGGDETILLEQPLPVGAVQVEQHLHRIAVACPALRIDGGEQMTRLRRPAPPQVVGQFVETVDLVGNVDIGRLHTGDPGRKRM